MKFLLTVCCYFLLLQMQSAAAETVAVVEDYAIFDSCTGPRDSAEFEKYLHEIENVVLPRISENLSTEYYGAIVGALRPSGERCFWIVDRVGKHSASLDGLVVRELKKVQTPALVVNEGCDLKIFPFAINISRGINGKETALPSGPPIPLEWNKLVEVGQAERVRIKLDHLAALACPASSASHP